MADGKPTIIDVARAAGASIKTVSRVINNERHVSAATRDRVLRVMADLQFHPNRSAQSLRGDRSYLIAHIYGDQGGYYTGEVQFGMLGRCRQQGYHLLIEEIDYRSDDVAVRMRSLVQQFSLDGVVLTAPVTDNEIVLGVLADAAVPTVRITPAREADDSASVRIDERIAAADLTRHLLQLGHRRIGFISGPAHHPGSALRYQGYSDALAAVGLRPDPALIAEGAFTFASSLPSARSLLALPDRPTALFASNDAMAAGVLRVANDLGLKLPDDLSVVGFDDAPLAELLSPALTTVRQPIQAMAEAAADMLMSMIAKRRAGEAGPVMHQVLPHQLVIRGSTAAPVCR